MVRFKYTTVVLSREADEATVRETASEWGLNFAPFENRARQKQLQPGDGMFLTAI